MREPEEKLAQYLTCRLVASEGAGVERVEWEGGFDFHWVPLTRCPLNMCLRRMNGRCEHARVNFPQDKGVDFLSDMTLITVSLIVFISTTPLI